MKLAAQFYLGTHLLDDEKLSEEVIFAQVDEVTSSNDEEALNEYLRKVLENDKPLQSMVFYPVDEFGNKR